MSIIDKLANIQQGLKAPKGQTNDFGKYKYRKCEDILESAKPHLDGAVILLSDEMVAVGDRVYVKATATLRAGEESISTTAYARESLTKKGMDDSQITGSASSYARKYALSGLLAIDNTDDADSQDNRNAKPAMTELDKQWVTAIQAGKATLDQITDINQRNAVKGYL